MSRATEQNDKLKRVIIISTVLYVILLTALIWSSLDESIKAPTGGGGGLSIDAVMVGSGAAAEQYKRMQNQEPGAKRSDEQRKMKEQRAAGELREKRAAERERLEQLEKERLAIQEQKRQAGEAVKQAELKQKQAEETAAKAVADAKVKAEADTKAAERATEKVAVDAKKRVEIRAAKTVVEAQREVETAAAALEKKAEAVETAAAETREKAAVEAAEKAKAEAERKAIAEGTVTDEEAAAGKAAADKEVAEKAAAEKAAANRKAATEKTTADKKAAAARAAAEKTATIKAAAEADDIFDELGSNKNAPKTRGRAEEDNASPARGGNTKNNGMSGADINNYAGQIKSTTESKFYGVSSYAGKTCTLRVKLASDGMLLDIKPEDGDPVLCQVALAATKLAKIPKSPDQAAYEVLKNASLNFKP